MAQNCSACNDLRETAPEFTQNGVTETVCTSLENDTGFNPSNERTDCDDLHDANDCLVGNLEDEIDAYDVCDWKDFMKRFIPNIYSVIKAIICAICGLWKKVHRYDCEIDALYNGLDIEFTEDYFTPGTGISFERPDSPSIDLSCKIKGNLARFHGSIKVDRSNSHWGSLGLANDGSVISGHRINTTDENWTIAILKFRKSEYPEIKKIYSDAGSFVNAACGQIRVRGHDEGTKYPGQWGDDSESKTVPAGWYYVRVDLSNLVTWGIRQNTESAWVTFDCLNMAEIDRAAIKCD